MNSTGGSTGERPKSRIDQRMTAVTLRESERAYVRAKEAAAHHANVREQHEKQEDRLHFLEGELKSLLSQLRNPPPNTDLEFLQSKCDKAEAEIELQKAVVSKFENAVNNSEQAWTLADISYHKFAAVEPELRAQQVKTQHKRERISRHQRVVEQTRAKSSHAANHQAVTQVLDTEYEQNEDAAKKLAATMQGRKVALGRVKAALDTQRVVKAAFDDKREQTMNERAQTILDLKRSIERSSNEMRGKNERKAQKRASREQRERKEFNKLLADGQNPYEVFRTRRLASKARKQEADLVQRIESSKMETIKRTLKFDEYALKKEEEEAKARQFANDYRDSMGRSIQEQRTREYMKSTTRDQTEWIDPSGRAVHIEPSEYMDLKLHSFGLGTKPAGTMIEKLKSKPRHRNVEPNPMFMLYDDVSDQEDDVGQQIVSANVGDGVTNRLKHTPVVPGKDVGGGAFNTAAADQMPMVGIGASDTQKEHGPNKFDPNITVFEQKVLKVARERQLQNIVEDQIVLGRKFKGVAFLSSPSVVEFNDFDVGGTYTRRIVLTNVSYTFNVFKLLALPKNVQNFFEVSYIKPGRMSAGTTCVLTISFTPKRPMDLIIEIPFLAQTGPFNVPVRCLQKRVLPSLSAEVIDFGVVVHGENEVRTVRISNDGALDTEFTLVEIREPNTSFSTSSLSGNHTDGPEENEEEEREEDPVSQSLALSHHHGKLPKHSFRIITLKFTPATTSGTLSKKYRVEFAHERSDSLELNIVGKVVDTPIFVEQASIDVHTCVVGKEYGVRVVFRNRGSVALRVDLSNVLEQIQGKYDFQSRRSTNISGIARGNQEDQTGMFDEENGFVNDVADTQRRGSTESALSNASSITRNESLNTGKAETVVGFFPSFGFVQARDKDKNIDGRFEVIAKFRPSLNFLKSSCNVRPWGSGKIYDFSVAVHAIVHRQTLPVTFNIIGKLTTGHIAFSANKRITLGDCIVSQSARVALTLRNTSALPQKYGFTVSKARGQLRVEPGDGFGVLLPFEERELSVVFSPNSAIEMSFALECHTIMGNAYKWVCVGRGIEAPLVFSNTLVQFGAAAPGNVFRQSIFLRNPATKASSMSKINSNNNNKRDSSEGKKGDGVRRFEFMLPNREDSGVWVTPRVGEVAPGETLRLEVEFRVQERKKSSKFDEIDKNEEVLEENANDVAADIKAENTKGSIVDESEELETTKEGTARDSQEQIPELSTRSESLTEADEPWSEHAEWMLPCFISEDLALSAKKNNNRPVSSAVMWVQVKTTKVETQLWSDKTVVSFGEVPAGSALVETIRLRNYGTNDSELCSLGLNPLGAFSILNSLRSINGGGRHVVTLQIKFLPGWSKSFRETLVLTTDTGTVQIQLQGKGVSPHFVVKGIKGHTLDMGDAFHGQRTSKQFTVSNNSTFPLHVCAQALGHVQNTQSGRLLFSISPEEATIAAGQSRKMLVEFAPDLPVVGSYAAFFAISTPNKDSSFAFRVHGYASAHQVYVKSASLPLPPELMTALAIQNRGLEDEDIHDLNVIEPSHRAFRQQDVTLVPGITPQLLHVPENHILEFRSEEGAPVQRSFVIGCLTAGENSSDGSFEFKSRPVVGSGFECSVSSGPLKTNTSVTVEVTFTPVAEHGAMAGEWTEEVVECELKGGIVPDGHDTTRVVSIMLRGRVQR